MQGTNNPIINVQSKAGSYTDNAGIFFGNGRSIVGYDGTYLGLKLASSDNSKPIIFGNSLAFGSREYARFTGIGNLGIGTATPKAQLHLYGQNQTTSATSTSTASGGSLYLQDSGFYKEMAVL
ncbi:MAG: hypothetical protein JWR50_3119 [Mucilaginibacter sp.]|nr:hypothetical protein [Mucilaginibacter sp.]